MKRSELFSRVQKLFVVELCSELLITESDRRTNAI